MLGDAFALYLSVKGRRVAHKLRCVFVDACALIEEEGEPREVILVARSQPCTYVRTYVCMCTHVHSDFVTTIGWHLFLLSSSCCLSCVAASFACAWLPLLVYAFQ